MRAILLALLVASALSATPRAVFTGTITDTECARDGHEAMRMGPTDAECVRACVVSHGASLVLHDGADVYYLSDVKAAEPFAARKVVVTGVLDPSTKTIQVESIAAAP